MRAHGWWRSLKDRGAERAPLNEGVRGEEAQGRQLPGKEMEGGTSPPSPRGVLGTQPAVPLCPSQLGREVPLLSTTEAFPEPRAIGSGAHSSLPSQG